MGCIEKKPNIA